MAIQIIGFGGVVADVDDTVYRALKVVVQPVDYGLLGSYRMSVATGTINATLTNGSVFQFYWPSATKIALVWGVLIDYGGSSANAGVQRFKLSVARLITANGTGGSTISVPGTSEQSQQLRTSMRPSSVYPVLVSTTAALVDGTWMLDNNPVGAYTFAVDASGTNQPVVQQVLLYGSMSRRTSAPIVLDQNEALNLSLSTVTTPTFVVGISIAWSETTYY